MDKTYEGKITITRRGIGFFSYDEEKDDFVIPKEKLNHALPGDTVKVEPIGMVEGPARSRREGAKVVEVVERARELFVGTLVKTDTGEVIVAPDFKKMYVPFAVAEPKFELGHKVLVKMTEWKESEEWPHAEVQEDIGVAGDHETEMRALVLGQGFSPDFPPAVVSEARVLESEGDRLIAKEIEANVGPFSAEATKGTRRDFRQIPTFTIDPADAKDFDDALSVRKLENGDIEVGVHIADVSYFVTPGSAIDGEGRNRATSIYLVDRTIPMLPHVLSNDLCSLNEDVDRLSMSAVFVLDKDANVKEKWFGETAMHSDKRFTYEEAQGVLDAGKGILYEELSTIRDLAKKIRAKRVAKGAIDFDTAEVKVILDENKKPIEIRLKTRQETNMLIEDFMLLANEAVAEHLAEGVKRGGNKEFAIYRVHDAPDAERIENLSQFLKVMGYDLRSNAGKVKGVDLNALLAKAKGTPEEYLIKMATLRSMSKAIYSTKNVGHFGLAFDFYTHFTSPIRRYPDLLVHRMVKHYEHERTVSAAQMAEFDALALHSSEREVAAAEAERDSIKLKIVEFMMDKVGLEFDAVISGANDRGLFVELKETHAEGLIKIRDIGDDFYVYDEKRYRLVGERTKTQYALGDPIRVKLTAARPLERELDFAIVK